jgi:tRNA-Thr(GGU) m(6)t(6)A37 methyltransferase TsaA
VSTKSEVVNESGYTVELIGVVRSPLTRPEAAPLQGDEGAPEAWPELTPRVARGLAGIMAGDELLVLTWLHLARRDVLQVHPRDNLEAPLTGVFATRSPDRPNPVGRHQVTVLEVAPHRLRVAPLEAVDGTPLVDLKPVLGDRRSSRRRGRAPPGWAPGPGRRGRAAPLRRGWPGAG